MDGISMTDEPSLEALLRRDEMAFVRLVERYQSTLLGLATLYVRRREIAEEVVQETWLAVIRGIDQFEGRSSLKTWLFSIATNRARTRAAQEARRVTISQLAQEELDRQEELVDPERLHGEPLHWKVKPESWAATPESELLTRESMGILRATIDRLPPVQREVLRLRDIEGLASIEVCNILEISETNQRVLLHRARVKVRDALESFRGRRTGT